MRLPPRTAADQLKLFDLPASLPNGLVYRPDFLTPAEEDLLLMHIENLPLYHPRYKAAETEVEYPAKRRIQSFGWGFDFAAERLVEGPPLPKFLQPAQRKIAKWLGIPPQRVVEALVTEYAPGAAIGFHCDRERFEHIIGVSLGARCAMQFKHARGHEETVAVELEPRSAYIMQGKVRWEWLHGIPHVERLRYSITFRTMPADWRG